MKIYFAFIVFAVALIVGCSKGNDGSNNNNNNNNSNGTGTGTTCTGTKSFATDVSPIIQNVCAASGCHNTGSTNGPGALTNYQQVFNARTQIRAAVASGTMPKNTTLSATQKNAIICWIDNGASDN